jgi:hypothetical protein
MSDGGSLGRGSEKFYFQHEEKCSRGAGVVRSGLGTSQL